MGNNNINTYQKICPVCGATDVLNGVPYIDDFVFCACCFFHFGIDDNETEPLMNARKQWLEEGLPFKDNIGDTKKKPWTLEMAISQLNKVCLIDTSLWPKYVRDNNSTWTASFDMKEVEAFWDMKRTL
jgi:hypothetical protein